jgi:hypothetical protein
VSHLAGLPRDLRGECRREGDRAPRPHDPPRYRANNRRGHGTFGNDRPPVAGVVGRRGGVGRFRGPVVLLGGDGEHRRVGRLPAMFEWGHNIKEVSDQFIQVMPGMRPYTEFAPCSMPTSNVSCMADEILVFRRLHGPPKPEFDIAIPVDEDGTTRTGQGCQDRAAALSGEITTPISSRSIGGLCFTPRSGVGHHLPGCPKARHHVHGDRPVPGGIGLSRRRHRRRGTNRSSSRSER